MVEADPSQFDTAVLNMVINARDAMPRGGDDQDRAPGSSTASPRCAATPPPAGAFIAVDIADNGTGMPPETLTKIFEPFFTTKAVDKGTGLGLSQVYGFAKQSRGEIDVEEPAGRRHDLHPVSAQRQRPGPDPGRPGRRAGRPDEPAPAPRPAGRGQRRASASFAAGLLKELGQIVTWVGDAQTALKDTGQDPDAFDLVFSDVVMPGISGAGAGPADPAAMAANCRSC